MTNGIHTTTDDTPKIAAINDTMRLLLSVLDLREPIEERTRASLLRTIEVCGRAVEGMLTPVGVITYDGDAGLYLGKVITESFPERGCDA